MGAGVALIVVESESKAATIGGLLGQGFVVLPSLGGGTRLEQLKGAREDSDRVFLAMDPGREGEAYAHHLATALRLDLSEANRVTFAELTRDAILDALDHPRMINMLLVQSADAGRRLLQQGPHIASWYLRQVADFSEESGLLRQLPYAWAASLVIDRERAIETFVPTEYWTVEARLASEVSEEPITFRVDAVPAGRLATPGKRGVHLAARADADGVAEALKGAEFKVSSVGGSKASMAPSPPFTTSTLLQAASERLGFSIHRTMRTARQLYEGIAVPDEGRVGLITSPHTDSVWMSDVTLDQIESLVRDEFGPGYAESGQRRFKARSRACGQDVHHAIRPSDVTRTPAGLAQALDRDALRLYTLIWQRTVASQMADARLAESFVLVEGRKEADLHWLTISSRATVFDGYRRVYVENDDGTSAESPLPELSAEQPLRLVEVLSKRSFTEPPARYSEASYLKEVDELGIDSASPVGGCLPQVLEKGFVQLDQARLRPTLPGIALVDKQREYFPGVFDVGFTCRMNDAIGEVAEGTLSVDQALDEVWAALDRSVDQPKPT